MLPVTNLPRPSVASVLAEVIEPDVLLWISKSEKRIGKDAYKTFIDTLPAEGQFGRLLHSACAGHEPPDAFQVCLDLKNVLDWPVDGELALLIVDALRLVHKTFLRARLTEWVMKTGTRFKAKDDDAITFKSGDKMLTGRVMSIDRPTASAFVKYGPEDDPVYKTVLAEDLVDVAG